MKKKKHSEMCRQNEWRVLRWCSDGAFYRLHVNGMKNHDVIQFHENKVLGWTDVSHFFSNCLKIFVPLGRFCWISLTLC